MAWHVVSFLVLLLFVYVFYCLTLRSKWAVPDDHEGTLFARADDGWRLAIHHVTPEKKDPKKHPVILCHGLGANRTNLHMPGDRSLARYLAARGYDCYVLELRGAGHSMDRTWFSRKAWDFGFNDFVDRDLPATIAHVREVTGSKKIHWVGHSMGGMVAYAYPQRHDAGDVASFCAIASPASFQHLAKLQALLRLQPLMKPFPTLHADWAVLLFLPLIGRWLPKAIEDNYYPPNMPLDMLRAAATTLVSPTSTKLLGDFASFVETGYFRGPTGHDYVENLHLVDRPFFLPGRQRRQDGLTRVGRVRLQASRVEGQKSTAFLAWTMATRRTTATGISFSEPPHRTRSSRPLPNGSMRTTDKKP